MARVQTGSIVTDIRGKLGGTIFQGNRFGLVMKNKSAIVNKVSLNQSRRRAALSSISSNWQKLSDAQRNSWSQWSQYQGLKHGTFKSRIMSGQHAYIQVNQYLAMLGETAISNPIFKPYSLVPLVFDSLLVDDSFGITPDSGPSTSDFWIIAYFSETMKASQNSRPRNLKYCATNVPISYTIEWKTNYGIKFGHFPPTIGYIWMEWFLIQKATYAMSSLTSQRYALEAT